MRVLFRLLLLIGWSGVIVPVQFLCMTFRLPVGLRIPHLWHKGIVWCSGLRISTYGTPSKAKPTLYVSNHVSYLDIVVLGSLLDAHFVSKQEVAKWPVFGQLAKLGQTVFIERNPRLAREQQGNLADILAEKRSLILFPEGTSSSGNRILPFKSTLFSVASLLEQQQDVHVTVQAVTVAYTHLNGIPLRRVLRPLIAWYGDMAMGPHLWRLLSLGIVGVEVTFHPPTTIESLGGRKNTASFCQSQVMQGLKESYRGRGKQT